MALGTLPFSQRIKQSKKLFKFYWAGQILRNMARIAEGLKHFIRRGIVQYLVAPFSILLEELDQESEDFKKEGSMVRK